MSVIKKQEVKIGTKKKIKVMCESYRSAMDVVEDCRTRKITDSNFNDAEKFDDWKWRGVKDYEQALDFLKNGYQPVVQELKGKIKATKKGAVGRISFQNNIVGFAPVVPLALQGVPNNMIDMRMKMIKCKVLDVYYDVTCSASVDSDDIIENGKKILGAILELERQGYRFNLYAVQTYSDDNTVDVLTVRIKSSDQPLDLKRISFPLTHTGFFRVIGFDWYSKCPEATYRYGYGRGLSYRLSESEREMFAKNMWGNNAVYIAGSKILHENEEHIRKELTSNERREKE